MSRLAASAVLAFTVGCSGDWLTGPGTPLELSHESLKGRWVHTMAEITMVANPSVVKRFRHSTDKGSILEFDGAGGVDHARVSVDGGANLPFQYTIRGDTLTLSFDYLAEVSTSRLVLTVRGVPYDFDGDGNREDAVGVQTYQKARD